MNSAQCGGKKQYASWSHAEREAKLLRRAKSAQAQPYHCGECGGIHVGNQLGGSHLAGRLRRAKLDRIRAAESAASLASERWLREKETRV